MTASAKLTKKRVPLKLLFRSLVVTLVGLLCSTSVLAQEDPKSATTDAPSQLECAAAHQDAQIERNLGNLLAAEAELTKCLHLECDPLIRTACGELLADVEAALPSIVLAATVEGEDLLDVTVDDGTRVLTERLNGVALPVNPGPLRLTFRALGMVDQTLTLVVRTGVQNRIVTVQMERDPATTRAFSNSAKAKILTPKTEQRLQGKALSAREAISPEGSRNASEKPRMPWAGYALLGGGAVLGAGGAALSLTALLDYKAAKHECAPSCSESVTNGIMTRAWVGNAMLGASVLAVALGIHQLATSKKGTPSEMDDVRPAPTAKRPELLLGLSYAAVRGTF